MESDEVFNSEDVYDEKRSPSPAPSFPTTVNTDITSLRSSSPAPSYRTNETQRTIRPSSPVPSYHTTEGSNTSSTLASPFSHKSGGSDSSGTPQSSVLSTSSTNQSGSRDGSSTSSKTNRRFKTVFGNTVGDIAMAEARFAAKHARNARDEWRNAKREVRGVLKRGKSTKSFDAQENHTEEEQDTHESNYWRLAKTTYVRRSYVKN